MFIDSKNTAGGAVSGNVGSKSMNERGKCDLGSGGKMFTTLICSALIRSRMHWRPPLHPDSSLAILARTRTDASDVRSYLVTSATEISSSKSAHNLTRSIVPFPFPLSNT